jgi:twitching motility protein PilU
MDMSELLGTAVQKDATDLYLIPESIPIVRVKDEIVPIGDTPLTPSETQQLANSVTDEEQKLEFDEESELNFAYEVASREGISRFRMNLYRSHSGISIVCRIVRSKIPSIEELGLPPVLKDLALEERGLILIVGAVASGKSSTMAALIDHRNAHRPGHILTIEDPLEFLHFHRKSVVSQREVGIDTKSYEAALKNALRQSPDVIAIGEIRDIETMSAAIHFAETGHLLLSTLHATNTHQTLERIINFYPLESRQNILLQLSINLKAIISQRLIPKADGDGQIAAVGILRDTPRIKDLIAKEEIEAIASAIEERNAEGMISIDQAIFNLYEREIITAEDALRFADSPNNLGIKIRRLENTRRQQQEAGRFSQPRVATDKLPLARG